MKLIKIAYLTCQIILLSIGLASAQWTQLGENIFGEAEFDFSGFSVSLSSNGRTLAIGAPFNSNNNGFESGQARIYEWSGTEWVQIGEDINGGNEGDLFGHSVSISGDGNRIAIGAVESDDNGSNAGQVQIFDWDGSAWIQVGGNIDGQFESDFFGWSISLSSNGNQLAIGANRNDGNGNNSGQVQIYEWNGSSWNQLGEDIYGENSGDLSGYVSISADGNKIAIGAIINDGNGNQSGHVRVYEWNGSSWDQLGEDINGENPGDRSGHVSLSGNGSRLAIGAPSNNINGEDAGHVRIFEWSGLDWVQLGNDIDGEGEGDLFGWSVSLSSGGNRIAIGARKNSNNEFESGQAQIYEWDGSDWIQLGNDIYGDTQLDQLGYAVALSSNGNVFALGAPWKSSIGTNSGKVCVYEGFLTSQNTHLPYDRLFNFNLTPNPATDYVFVSIENIPDLSNCIIELLDIKGEVIHKMPADNTLVISLDNLPSGSYSLLLKNKINKKILAAKILIIY